MTRRKIIGLTLALGASLAGGAGALAVAAHGRGETIMRRVATAVLHDALDEVRATPEQRARVQSAAEGVFALVADHRQRRTAARGRGPRRHDRDRAGRAARRARARLSHRDHATGRRPCLSVPESWLAAWPWASRRG